MDTITRPTVTMPHFSPYDPAESPGPIPSVIERFRPKGYDPDEPDPESPEVIARRYTVILVPPEHTEALRLDRSEAGLKLYAGDDWDADVSDLYDAARQIEDGCGFPVTLVEHRSDLTYWTARPRHTPGNRHDD